MSKTTTIIVTLLGLCALVTLFVVFVPTQEEAPLPVVKHQSKILLHESVPLHRVELSSEALAVWRDYSAMKPTLLLLSDDLMLQPVPENLLDQVEQLVLHKSQQEIAHSSHPGRTDVIMLPSMTTDIALDADMFDHLAWALPIKDPGQSLNIEAMRQDLIGKGVIDEWEADSLSSVDNVMQGSLRKTGFTAAVLQKLPELKGPVVLHIDPSYFQGLYKNGVATPIFSIVNETLAQLRDRNIPVLAVTYCYGNLNNRIGLDVRFIGDLLRDFFETPETFGKPLPRNWQQLAEILYLNHFFEKEKVRDIATLLAEELPESAWARYQMYHAAANFKQGKEAIEHLAETVAQDKVYALEYLVLANTAYQKGFPDQALRMLKRAQESFPEDHQVVLQVARLATEITQYELALELVEDLQKRSWSTTYYPDMPRYLTEFESFLRERIQ